MSLVSTPDDRIKIIDEINKSGYVVNTESFKMIKKQLKDDGIIAFPEALKLIIANSIRKVYADHPVSRRKLSKKSFQKEYEWNTTISKWLGESNAQKLYDELNNKSN